MICISFDVITIWKPVISVCAVSSKFSFTLTFCQQRSRLLHFVLCTKVKTVLRAFGSGRKDPFLEAFWNLLIHMNEPCRPTSRLLSPAAPLGGDEIRQSRQTYQPKGSYTEPTEKRSMNEHIVPVQRITLYSPVVYLFCFVCLLVLITWAVVKPHEKVLDIVRVMASGFHFCLCCRYYRWWFGFCWNVTLF